MGLFFSFMKFYYYVKKKCFVCVFIREKGKVFLVDCLLSVRFFIILFLVYLKVLFFWDFMDCEVGVWKVMVFI